MIILEIFGQIALFSVRMVGIILPTTHQHKRLSMARKSKAKSPRELELEKTIEMATAELKKIAERKEIEPTYKQIFEALLGNADNGNEQVRQELNKIIQELKLPISAQRKLAKHHTWITIQERTKKENKAPSKTPEPTPQNAQQNNAGNVVNVASNQEKVNAPQAQPVTQNQQGQNGGFVPKSHPMP